MPRSREQEAGVLYERGAKAVRAGGDELHMLASHLKLMIQGTVTHQGPLWPMRILHDGYEIRLDRFIDYLRKPAREGLGLPSLHFLRQVLKASPNDGEKALDLVSKELAKEHVDLDAVADRERDTALLKRELQATGRPAGGKGTPGVPSKGGTDRRAAQLAKRRPDLAEKVRAGTMKLSAALKEAGIRKPPNYEREFVSRLEIYARILAKNEQLRREFLAKLSCATTQHGTHIDSLPIERVRFK